IFSSILNFISTLFGNNRSNMTNAGLYFWNINSPERIVRTRQLLMQLPTMRSVHMVHYLRGYPAEDTRPYIY
ncbi:hypothetical protein PMAYCL1PPCAC_04895, partial [Pristionchus mayeri]